MLLIIVFVMLLLTIFIVLLLCPSFYSCFGIIPRYMFHTILFIYSVVYFLLLASILLATACKQLVPATQLAYLSSNLFTIAVILIPRFIYGWFIFPYHPYYFHIISHFTTFMYLWLYSSFISSIFNPQYFMYFPLTILLLLTYFMYFYYYNYVV